MELTSVDLILELRGLHVILESAEIIFAEFSLLISLESLVKRRLLTFVILSIDGSARCLGEGFTEQVFRLNLRHIAGISWNVLSLQILSGTSEPVLSLL